MNNASVIDASFCFFILHKILCLSCHRVISGRHFQDLNERDFTALVNLLLLKHRTQLEPMSRHGYTVDSEGSSDRDDGESNVTNARG